jgi:hypothetical protein
MNNKYPSPFPEGKDEKANGVGGATDLEKIQEESPEEKQFDTE